MAKSDQLTLKRSNAVKQGLLLGVPPERLLSMRSAPTAGHSGRNWARPVLRLIEASELLDRQVTTSRGDKNLLISSKLEISQPKIKLDRINK